MDHIPTTHALVAKLRREGKNRVIATGQTLTNCLNVVAIENGYRDWLHVVQCRLETGDVHDLQDEAQQSKPGAANKRRRTPKKFQWPYSEGVTLSDGVSLGRSLVGMNRSMLATVDDYYASLAAEGMVEVTRNPTPVGGNIFIDVTIEGHRFQAIVSDAPFIKLKSVLQALRVGDCQLGVASIAYVETPHLRGRIEHWAICKHCSQPRIDVSGMSEAGLRTLAIEFGLPMLPENDLLQECVYFYGSAAYIALVKWATLHKSRIKRFPPNTYLGHWALSVAVDAGIQPGKTDVKQIAERLVNHHEQLSK